MQKTKQKNVVLQKKFLQNLDIPKKLCTFAPAFGQQGSVPSKKDRDLAQLVAHTSGGREVAGSSPVIPTERKPKLLEINSLGFFYIPNWRDFGVITIFNEVSGLD